MWFPNRILLQPSFEGEEYCSSSGSCSTFEMAGVSVASIASFEHELYQIFYNSNSTNGSIHGFLDTAANEVLCKIDNSMCPQPTETLPGFRTRIEKAYVALFVFFGACSVMLGIVLLSICYEDRVLKAERRASSSNKMFKSERSISGVSLQSNDEG